MGACRSTWQPAWIVQAGWEGFRAVQESLGDPLYLLTPDVQRRFQIERVPAVVEARDGGLVVVEWVPEGSG